MSPPRLIGASDLPPPPSSTLTLADVEKSLAYQLGMHGLEGRVANDARAAARNAMAALWLEFQGERSARTFYEARAAELERKLALRPCAWAEHDFRPDQRIGAHVCARCSAVDGGPLVDEPPATTEVDLSGGAR